MTENTSEVREEKAWGKEVKIDAVACAEGGACNSPPLNWLIAGRYTPYVIPVPQKEPKIWESVRSGKLLHGNPLKRQLENVMAGLR